MKYIISACLLGDNCKYDGGNNYNEKAVEIFNEGNAVKACPECLGHLSTPRTPFEINGGTGEDVLSGKSKVISKDGTDVTKNFIMGAKETLKIALENKVTHAIVKARSPSCGYKKIYDGTFSSNLIDGNGVAVQMLVDNGIKVITELDL